MNTTDASSVGRYFQEQLIKHCFEGSQRHNHPPVRKIVHGCVYCEMFGNEFASHNK
mgnify:CR=1 FL=1